MRLFLAIETGLDIARAASELIVELKRRTAQLAPRARITWVPPERLHLTVRFIGEADETLDRTVRAALERSFTIDPFDLTVQGAGAFPARGRPRAIWAGVTSGRDAFLALSHEVGRRLEGVPELGRDREASPHLTLARVRDARGVETAGLLDGLADTVLGTTRVESVALHESRLSSKGPTYVPLLRIRLGSV